MKLSQKIVLFSIVLIIVFVIFVPVYPAPRHFGCSLAIRYEYLSISSVVTNYQFELFLLSTTSTTLNHFSFPPLWKLQNQSLSTRDLVEKYEIQVLTRQEL